MTEYMMADIFHLPSDLSEESGAKTEMKSGCGSLPPIPPIGSAVQAVEGADVVLA